MSYIQLYNKYTKNPCLKHQKEKKRSVATELKRKEFTIMRLYETFMGDIFHK